jgi:hypothetical protein
MSTEYQTLSGEFHLILKIRGTPTAIALYHRYMRRCDSDWPWKEANGCRICEHCCGIVYHNPRINPEDIKIAAKQVSTMGYGDIRVKVTRYTPSSQCFTRPGIHMAPTMWVSRAVAFDMYTPGGPLRTREAIAEANKPVRPYPPSPGPVMIQ